MRNKVESCELLAVQRCACAGRNGACHAQRHDAADQDLISVEIAKAFDSRAVRKTRDIAVPFYRTARATCYCSVLSCECGWTSHSYEASHLIVRSKTEVGTIIPLRHAQ